MRTLSPTELVAARDAVKPRRGLQTLQHACQSALDAALIAMLDRKAGDDDERRALLDDLTARGVLPPDQRAEMERRFGL